jgi:4-hydroxybutyrate dehydrogenase
MDLGKGVGILANNEGDLGEFGFGGGKMIASLPPLIAIPTTAGTGSEVSVGAVIILNDGRKMTFAGPLLVPSFAICDPELTLGLPKMLTAATGMDAVTHCIEAFLSKNVNPVADAIALDGLERAVGHGNLEKAVADGSDRDARYNMMLASTEGALAFVKGLGAVHSMSHSCGRIKELNLHHGTLNAVILPPILRFNESVVGDKYPRLRKAMGLADGSDLAVAIEELNGRLGLPANLGEMGVTKEMMDDLVKYADMDLANYSTPRRPTPEEFETLYLELLP